MLLKSCKCSRWSPVAGRQSSLANVSRVSCNTPATGDWRLATRLWLLILLLLPTPLLAQSELQLFVGGYNPGSEVSVTTIDSGALFGFRYGGSFLRIFGSEFAYTFIKDLEDKARNFDGNAHLLNGNVLLQVPVGDFVPFATLGMGSILGKSDTLLRVRKTFAFNAGGGIKIRKLAGPAGLRVDVRFYKVPDGLELLGAGIRKVDFDFAEVSAGLLFTF